MSHKYRPTIGIECHVQLKTKTKLFSGANNDARTAEPNTLVNHIDFGLPGALPVFNREALKLAVRAALALKSEPELFSTFDRKHYFYPDLPMGYQITQYDQPIISGGQVNFKLDGQVKTVGITRAHLESDAGKSTHPEGSAISLVDLNRAGTPLLEIVSEPEMHTAAEARAYTEELYLLMRYAGVTEGDLYHGNMRFDVNVSLSQTDELGVRSETKNLNSFRAVEKAIAYEIKRQSELLDAGKAVIQETRGWNEAKQKTVSQRTKENADDYRYMPDPDLPPLVIDQAYIEKIRAELPSLPDFWRKELGTLQLDEDQIQLLLEANIDFEAVGYMTLIKAFLSKSDLAKTLVNWLVNIEIPLMRSSEASVKLISSARNQLYSEVMQLSKSGQLSSTGAKELITKLLMEPELPSDITSFAEQANLLQQSDQNEIETIVKRVLDANPNAVKDIQKGETKAIGFLIGQVMSQSAGRANPELTRQIIEQLLK